MLTLLRRGVKTWVAKILFALLVASFAIWGIGDVFTGGLGSSVATVGDQKISAERYTTVLNQEIRAQSERFGQPIDAETARAIGLDRQVLGRMAQEATLDQAMVDLSVSAPNGAVSEVIRSDPNFRSQGGGFDQETYRYLIAQANFSVEGYEAATRRSIARAELARALSDGGLAPQGAIDAIYEYRTETRTFDYVTLTGRPGEIGAPDEAALQAYHEANPDAFTAPERRDAVYLHLGVDALTPDFEPDRAALEALYEQRKSEYDLPERRTLFQLVYDNEEAAQSAVERLTSGEADFEALLAERGESRADTSLGEVTEAEVTPAVGEAAFGAEETGVVGPVDTGFGFALVDVAEITPAEMVPLEEARSDLIPELRREAAYARAPKVAGQVQDRIAGGSTLEEIAEALDLPLGRATGVAETGAGAEGFARNPDFLAEIFTADESGARDLLETEAGEYFVLRVDRIAPSAVRPLDEVRSEVEAAWRAEQVREALSARAETMVERIGGGQEIGAVAEEAGLEVTTAGPKSRVEGWDAFSPDLLEALFKTAPGDAASGPAPGDAQTMIVAEVVSVTPGEESAENDELRSGLARQMNAMAGNDALSLYITAKQREIGVSVDQELVDSLLNQGAGGY